jgi:hypothetical protein
MSKEELAALGDFSWINNFGEIDIEYRNGIVDYHDGLKQQKRTKTFEKFKFPQDKRVLEGFNPFLKRYRDAKTKLNLPKPISTKYHEDLSNVQNNQLDVNMQNYIKGESHLTVTEYSITGIRSKIDELLRSEYKLNLELLDVAFLSLLVWKNINKL